MNKPTKPVSKARATYSAPALEKGLDILELLTMQDVGLSLSEIARALGRSVGEIFRMVNVLQERGYVAQEPDSDRYVLTTYLFEISHRIPTIRRLTAVAGPLMRALAKTVNQSVHMAVTSGDSILVIGQVDAPGNNTMSVRLGAKIDLWRASSGRIILAHLPKEDIEVFFKAVPRPAGMLDSEIRADLKKIKEIGHEVRDSFVARGVVNISAPVIDHSGHAIAALTIPHIEKFMDPVSFETCRDELVAAARALSRALGGAVAS